MLEFWPLILLDLFMSLSFFTKHLPYSTLGCSYISRTFIASLFAFDLMCTTLRYAICALILRNWSQIPEVDGVVWIKVLAFHGYDVHVVVFMDSKRRSLVE